MRKKINSTYTPLHNINSGWCSKHCKLRKLKYFWTKYIAFNISLKKLGRTPWSSIIWRSSHWNEMYCKPVLDRMQFNSNNCCLECLKYEKYEFHSTLKSDDLHSGWTLQLHSPASHTANKFMIHYYSNIRSYVKYCQHKNVSQLVRW